MGKAPLKRQLDAGDEVAHEGRIAWRPRSHHRDAKNHRGGHRISDDLPARWPLSSKRSPAGWLPVTAPRDPGLAHLPAGPAGFALAVRILPAPALLRKDEMGPRRLPTRLGLRRRATGDFRPVSVTVAGSSPRGPADGVGSDPLLQLFDFEFLCSESVLHLVPPPFCFWIHRLALQGSAADRPPGEARRPILVGRMLRYGFGCG